MQWTGKLVGGVLGALLGPAGVAAGVLVGHQYDLNAARRGLRPATQQLFFSTFRMMGHVAKADGRVSEREIEAARAVMRSLRLDPLQVRMAIDLFTQGKAAQFDPDAELAELRGAARGNPDVLRVFLEIQLRFALHGSDLAGAARVRVMHMAAGLGVDPLLFARMEASLRGGAMPGSGAAMGQPDPLTAAYRALEVDPGVSDADLKLAYRRLMSRHHPDKLKANGLPESMLEHAKQRTQVIRESYERVCRHRGIA